MKRLLALLLACLLLVLNACGTPTEDAANTERSELTAEELPELVDIMLRLIADGKIDIQSLYENKQNGVQGERT